VIREAGGEDCCVEPAQEHKEVLLGDVSNGWPWSNFIHPFGLGGELGCGCCGCRIKDMYMHFNKRSGLMAPLVAEDVYEIIMKVRFWFSPDTFLTGAPFVDSADLFLAVESTVPFVFLQGCCALHNTPCCKLAFT
jgi:hypothetical protein